MAIRVLVISDYRTFHTPRPEAQIFVGLAKLGLDITVMTYPLSAHRAAFEAAGIKMIDYHPDKKYDRTAIKRIRQTIIAEQIDVMHLFNNRAIINGIQAAKGLRVKVVLYRGYTGNIHWYDPTAWIKFLHPRVDMIFCNSKGVEEEIQRQLFFDKRKTITINKGHDIRWYEDVKGATIREDLGIPIDALLLICVANNRKMKGVPYLLRAVSSLPPDLHIHLLLAGENMDTEENLQIIKQAQNKNNIHILGSRGDVLSVVKASDAFTLASIKGESITKSVLEAMSMGVTPVISDIPGNRELVVEGESGLVFPSRNVGALKDAILRLYHDRALCKRLGENARKRIQEHLSNEQTVIKTKALYESLAGQT